MPGKPILIMAGGTGGHVYPALAVADCLSRYDTPLFWLGTRNGFESRIVPRHKYELFTIDISGLRGKGLLKWCVAPFSLMLALLQAARIILRVRPAAVLGMGGFASGPGGLAAWLLRVPLCIHEQNAVAGMTNRILSHFARVVMEAFPGTFPGNRNIYLTGNPVRQEICEIPPPEQRINTSNEKPLKLLVLGGSQGARTLNRIVPSVLVSMQSELSIEVKHQTGKNFHDETRVEYRNVSSSYELYPYMDEMSEAYSWADIVLCRAGALTVAEIAAAGVASILVPYPFAVDDHQTVNAMYLVRANAAICIQEKDLDIHSLCELLTDLCNSREKLLVMAREARKLSRPDASGHVAKICREVAYGRSA